MWFVREKMKGIICVLILGLVLFSGCIGAPSSSEEGSTEDIPQKKHVMSPQATTLTDYLVPSEKPQKPVEFNVIARKFEFEPAVIKVKQGDFVRLKVTSTDADHGIAIDELGINVKVPEGETKIVEFMADKKGEFTFMCSVFCGSGHSRMKGTLIVD